MAGFVTEREQSIDLAKEYLNQFYRSTAKSNQDKAFYLLFMGLIEARDGNVAKAIDLGNESVVLSPDFIKGVLNGAGTPYKVSYKDRFEDLGITYLADQNQFELINKQ